MAKGTWRQLPKDDPIFSGRFVISSKNSPQESTSSTKKPNAPSREVKPETGGYEIFARFVAIVLVGALPAFCINVAKTTVRTVGKNADSVVLSKAGRELRLSRNPEDNDLPGLVGRAVIKTVGRASRKENCEDDRQGEAGSEQCDQRDQPTKVRDVTGKAYLSTQEARHRR
jgi:hypothetical protein